MLFISSTGIFSKTDPYACTKASLNRNKKTEITSCILLDYHRLKLDINNNRNKRKFANSWKLNKSLLNENVSGQKSRMKLKPFRI